MTNSVMGMNSYYSAFVSPLKSYETTPVANLIYGAAASKAYSQTVAKKLQSGMSSYLTSLSRTVNDIKSNAKPLVSQGTDSSFNQKTISSTNEAAVTGTAAPTADMKTVTLNISKLATAQVNSGKALNSKDIPSISMGVNSFKLKVGNTEKNITVSMSETDTNKSALEKISKAINSVKAGVSASVTTDSKTGTSSLKITADKTGTDNNFSLSDTQGNAVSAAGLDTVSTQAQNAEYTLDGKQYTSQSNSVSINNDQVKLTFSKAEGKDIKLTVTPDTKKIASDVKEFVKSYNDMVQLANSSTTDFKGAEKLKDELFDIMKSRKTSLLQAGISQNNDGTLAVDDKKLESELKNNPESIKSTFQGPNGVANSLYKKANEILSSPMKYTKPQDMSSSLNFLSNDSGTSNSMTSFQFSQSHRLSGQSLYAGLVVDTLL